MPTRLAQQVEFLERFPNLGACGTWALASTPEKTLRRKASSQRYRYVVNPRYLRFWQLFENQIATSSCMMRASAAATQKFSSNLAPTEDWAFWNEIGFRRGLANIPKFLSRLTLSSESFAARARAKQVKGWDSVWAQSFERFGLTLTPNDLTSHRMLTYNSRGVPADFDCRQLRHWCDRLLIWASTLSTGDRQVFTKVLSYFMLRFEWRTQALGMSLFDSRKERIHASITSSGLLLGQKSPLAKVLS